MRGSHEISTSSVFFVLDSNVFKTILSIQKIFQSDQIQRSYREKFTAHYTCRNADLNLRPFADYAKTKDSFFK